MRRLIKTMTALAPLVWLGAASAASYVLPDHYTYQAGEGSFRGVGTTFGDYLYKGEGGQLANEKIGQDNWTLDGAPGLAYSDDAYTPGYTWVGWHTVEPTMTFYFPEGVNVDRIEIGFNRDEWANIYLPEQISITQHSAEPDKLSEYRVQAGPNDATLTDLAGNPLYKASNLGRNSEPEVDKVTYHVGHRDWLVFEGPFQGTSFTIGMQHLPDGWATPTTQTGWEATHWVFVDEVRFRVPEWGASLWLALGSVLALASLRRKVAAGTG